LKVANRTTDTDKGDLQRETLLKILGVIESKISELKAMKEELKGF
jgi:hypothetical protein